MLPILGGLQVVHTPGHTPGSVCYLWRERVFTGAAFSAPLNVALAGRTMGILLSCWVVMFLITFDCENYFYKKKPTNPTFNKSGRSVLSGALS